MLIALDYDGVLVDSLEEISILINRELLKHGVKKQVTTQNIQEIEDFSFHALADFIGLPRYKLIPFAHSIFCQLRSKENSAKIFFGMPEVIKALAEEHTIVLITSNVKEQVKSFLNDHNLADSVSMVFDGTDFKGKTGKIKSAIKALKFDKQNTVMVGDTVSDIRSGKKAGVKTIAVTWGYQIEKTLIKEAPDFLAYKPTDLLEICQLIK